MGLKVARDIWKVIDAKLKTKYENYSTSNSNADFQSDENIAKIWIKIPYLGNRGENIMKSCTSKFKDF